MKQTSRFFILLPFLFLLFNACDHYRFAERKYRPGIFRDHVSQNYSGDVKEISKPEENNFSNGPKTDILRKVDVVNNSPGDHSLSSSKKINASPLKDPAGRTPFWRTKQDLPLPIISLPHQPEDNSPLSSLKEDSKTKNNEVETSDDDYLHKDNAGLGSAIAAILLALAMWGIIVFALPACADLLWIILLMGICAFGLAAVSIDEAKRKFIQALDVIAIVATCIFVILALAAVLGGSSKNCGSHSSGHSDWNLHSHHYYNSNHTYQDTLTNKDQKIPEYKK